LYNLIIIKKEFVYNKKDNKFQKDPVELTNEINITPKNHSSVSVDSLTQINQNWFINLSGYNIPDEVSYLLQLGEGFSVPAFKNKKELVIEFIKDLEDKGLAHNDEQKLKIKDLAINKLQKFIKNEQYLNDTQKKILHLIRITRPFCKENQNIIFTKADKGNVTVALNRIHYYDSMNKLLADKTTYEIIHKNPVKNIESKLSNLLKRWFTLGFITKQELFSLRGSDCSLPRAYGLPKIHKENIPFKIIVSSINTSLYSFANYLQKILHRSLPLAQSNVRNSSELFKTLIGMKIPEKHTLTSLDVSSLFTNIPEELVIEALNSRWNLIQKETKITKKEFIIAVQFIFNSTYFTFDDITYRQIFGTPMGSPLSPVLADIVMQDLEQKALNKLDFSLPIYYRYVDDILLLTPFEKIDVVLNTFNGIHSRLKFTLELEKNRSISFLDLRLIINNGILFIDWFRKDTCSGRYLHYYSGHPIYHKIGTIYGLVDRALLLSHPVFH